jgi:LmbE family N-acetylglucosaminyl deacetylase
MITETEAAGILGVDQPTVIRLATADLIHTIQTISGNLRVCMDSLFQNRR